jgi:hypothetical protein
MYTGLSRWPGFSSMEELGQVTPPYSWVPGTTSLSLDEPLAPNKFCVPRRSLRFVFGGVESMGYLNRSSRGRVEVGLNRVVQRRHGPHLLRSTTYSFLPRRSHSALRASSSFQKEASLRRTRSR